jgi:L-galactono-1,4-lactone dehydrogenase
MKTSPHDARDIELVENFMAQARQNTVVNHTPLEMRWSRGSRSILSPARGTPEDLFVWIGIIHYLPSQDAAQRQQITSSFEKLNEVFQRVANEKGTVRQHWAKLELPANHRTKHGQPTQALVDFQARLAEQYEFRHVASLRHKYDMNGIMSNDWLDSVMGRVVTESDTLFKRLREMQK